MNIMTSELPFLLLNGDCIELMKEIPDGSIDMILCDLPYETLNRGNRGASWDRRIPLDKLWEQYERIIKDNGAIVLFAQSMFTAQLMFSKPELWRYNLVWDKVLSGGFLNARRMPLRSHEDICVFYKKLPKYNPQMSEGKPLHGRGTAYRTKELTNNCYGSMGAEYISREGCTEKFPTSIIRVPKPHPSTTMHPTQKPVGLCEWLIRTFTEQGDIVLDNAMGSGSTGVACLKNGRKFIGMELNGGFFDIARNRIEHTNKGVQDSM